MITEWSVINFKGVSSFQTLSGNPEIFRFSGDPIPGTISTQTFRNKLTILNFSIDLDRVTIFCGSNTSSAQAHFFSEFTVSLSYLIFLLLIVHCDCEHKKNLCRPTKIT
jgi:hypothetical protein